MRSEARPVCPVHFLGNHPQESTESKVLHLKNVFLLWIDIFSLLANTSTLATLELNESTVAFVSNGDAKLAGLDSHGFSVPHVLPYHPYPPTFNSTI
jgi:hypothetical protein